MIEIGALMEKLDKKISSKKQEIENQSKNSRKPKTIKKYNFLRQIKMTYSKIEHL